jgi:hypothetical protein
MVGEGGIVVGALLVAGTLAGWRLAGVDVTTVVRAGEVAGAAHAVNSRPTHSALITVDFIILSSPSG